VSAQAPKPIYRQIKPGRTLEVFSSAGDLFHAAASEVVEILSRCLDQKPWCAIALSGGSTPKRLYQLLAQGAGGRMDWSRVRVFFSDERNVPPTDDESNYRMAKESLFSSDLVPEKNIYRIQGELSADVAAQQYEQEIKNVLGKDARFDLVLLGLGPDGHTASLFPESPALHEKERLVVANRVAKLNTDRITFTYPLLNRAASVLFLASGSDKARIVRTVLSGEGDLPSQRVQPANGGLVWMLDKDSAKLYLEGMQRS
jgi:6-phosphogluconolactonase